MWVIWLMLGVMVLGAIAAFKFLRWFWREMMTIREIKLDKDGNRIE